MAARQGTLPWWDQYPKLAHKTTLLSEEGQAMAICQRTTLSHLAALALPWAGISQALITYSSTVCAFSRLCRRALTMRQTKVCVSWQWKQPPHAVLVPVSIPRPGIFTGKGVRCPRLCVCVDENYSVLTFSLFNSE